MEVGLGHLFHQLLLLAGGLDAWTHDGILARHSAAESAVELRTEGELAKVVRLFFVEGDALGREGLVLHAVEAGGNVANLGMGRVGGLKGWRHGGRDTVGAESDRRACLEGHFGVSRVGGHGDAGYERKDEARQAKAKRTKTGR